MISFDFCAKVIGALFSAALFTNTGCVSATSSPITTGVFGFMIPAFSPAILASVLPRNCVWSRLMFVIIDNSGLIMLVQSSLPPNPTSTTAMSTFCCAKYLKAMAVVSSKKLGCSGSKKERSFSTKSIT